MSNTKGVKKHISPWGLTVLAFAGSAVLFTLNEIFASGSETATTIINIQFIILMIAALLKSFSKCYSRAYCLWFLCFVLIFVIGVVSLSFYNRCKTREWERRNEADPENRGLHVNE